MEVVKVEAYRQFGVLILEEEELETLICTTEEALSMVESDNEYKINKLQSLLDTLYSCNVEHVMTEQEYADYLDYLKSVDIEF